MLWLKGWMETRFRLLFMLGLTGVSFLLIHSRVASAPPHPEVVLTAVVSYSIPAVLMMICGFLAGAGIATQPSLQATKGLHGSMLYTLSMPVSRLRLVAVRVAIGWLEVAGLIGVLSCELWFGMRPLMVDVTPLQMVEQAGTLIVSISVLYFVSVVLATLLDDQWRTWGTLFAAIATVWLVGHVHVPPMVNVYWAMTKGSPLLAHSIPWSAMGFSAALSVVLFFVAVAIARRREY